MNPTNFSPKDWEWLVSDEAADLLSLPELATLETFRCLVVLREKYGLSAERASLVALQFSCRQRAVRSFSNPERMFFLPTSLEQATDEWVAAYKAARFPAQVPVADICCGIGGDLMALAKRGPVIGVDCDAMVARLAQKNLETVPEAGDSTVLAMTAEAFLETYPAERFPCLHIDPDRRAEGVRTARMEFSAPGVETIDRLLEGRRLVALKLAPGNPCGNGEGEILERWGDRLLELEWIGRDRQCRQLVAWFGNAEMKQAWEPETRWATILPPHDSRPLRRLAGSAEKPLPPAELPGKFLFDVDSTVLAAKLEGTLAEEYALRAAFPGSIYLTGDCPITDDAALECFEVLEILPFDRKRLKRAIAERNWGILEIKKRGATPTPEEVRKLLKLPKNKHAGTLLLAQTSAGVVAVLAQRVG